MYKKRLLGLAIASTLALGGCLESNQPVDTSNEGAITSPSTPSLPDGVYPIFSPATSAFPIPNDLLFPAEPAGDGTFPNLGPIDAISGGASYNPVTGALGGLSGASTVAGIDIPLSGLIDASSVVGNSPNPAQNVFLVELTYASGDPLQGLSIGEPATVVPTPVPHSAEVKTLDGVSYIRILPTEPLKPLTRYVVMLTDGITDLNGDPIHGSPTLLGYASLTSQPVADPALQAVKDLIDRLWEPTALGYANNLRSMASLDPLTDANVALTYSFTTSGDEKVLNYINDPRQWFNDQLTRFVGVSTASAIVTGQTDVNMDGNVDYDDVNLAVQGALAAFPANPSDPMDTTVADALAPLEAAFGLVGCTGVTAGSAYIDCISRVLVTLPVASGGFADLLPTPQAAAVDFTGGTSTVHPDYPNVTVATGEMTIPYYARPPADIGTGAPAGTNAGAGAPLKYLYWEADDTLATAINAAFGPLGLSLPQANPATTTFVNYIFPFPKQQDADVVTPGVQDLTIPITAVYPTANSGNMKTMILGHGLGGSRCFATGATGAGLVSAAAAGVGLPGPAEFAILAIDQPLHGLKSDCTSGATTLISQTANERHFGYAEAGPGLPPRALTTADNLSLLFVNIESFLTTRDNNRQNVLDLLSLRKAVGSIDIDGGGADLDGTDVYYQGYSLGTISAQAFVAVANDANQVTAAAAEITTDNIEAAFFSTPGGGIARFFESSPAFTANIVNGLAANSLTADTGDYQTYFRVIQHALDAFDAVNFVSDYPSQSAEILYYSATNDQVIPVSQVPGRELSAPTGTTLAGVTLVTDLNASASYLSGAEPLFAASGANATALTTAGANQAVTRNFIRFAPTFGSHGGPCAVTGAAGATEFGGYALGMLDLFGAGPAVSISADAGSTWIDADPIDSFFATTLTSACDPNAIAGTSPQP